MPLFDEIQIGQVLVVDGDVVGSPHPGNAVNREAGELIDRHAQIEQRQWNNYAVDDGRGKEVLRAHAEKPAKDTLLEPKVRLPDGTLELDALPFDLIKQSAFLLMEFCPQFVFECGYLVADATHFFIHGAVFFPVFLRPPNRWLKNQRCKSEL